MEELSFLGIPLIASAYGPWGSDYVFGYFWRDKVKYEEVLRKLDDVKDQIFSDNQNGLYDYIKDKDFAEIKTYGFFVWSSWLSFLKHFSVSSYHEFSINMEAIKYILHNINKEDRRFSDYLKDRASKIKLLCDYKTDITH